MKEYINLYDNGGMTFGHYNPQSTRDALDDTNYNWFENYFTITS